MRLGSSYVGLLCARRSTVSNCQLLLRISTLEQSCPFYQDKTADGALKEKTKDLDFFRGLPVGENYKFGSLVVQNSVARKLGTREVA